MTRRLPEKESSIRKVEMAVQHAREEGLNVTRPNLYAQDVKGWVLNVSI